MDARVNFSQPVPDVEPHERRPLVRQATDAPGQPSSNRHSSKYAVGGLEESSYEVDHSDNIPKRSKATPPKDFGHPRGLAEDPVRPGCYSNFGKGGVRHYRKRGSTTSQTLDNHLMCTDGGLAPTAGPVRYGHQTTGLGSISPEGPNQRRVPYLNQRKENFIGCLAPLPPEEVRTKYPPGYRPPADAPWANHFEDAKYSWTNHNDVFGPGGERRHVIPEDPAKDPKDTSHLFRNPDSPPAPPGKYRSEKPYKAPGEFSERLSPRDRSKAPSWGWNPKPGRGETQESIPDIIGTHQNHTAGKMHRKKHVEPNLDEREYYGASSQRMQAVRPVKKQIEPDWKVRNTFETVGLTPQILNPDMDMHRNEDPRFLKEEQRRQWHQEQYSKPQPHAGAMPAPPVYQTIRRKTYEGERNVHHQDSFATVGLTPEMMGIPREYQAGAPKPGKAPVPVDRSAGAPSEMVQERRVGKKVTQYGIDQRSKNTFDTVGVSMTFMKDGEPMGEPVKDPRTRDTRKYYPF